MMATVGKQATADQAEIRRAVGILFEPGQVVELRALDVVDGRFVSTVSGYFNDMPKLAQAAARLSPRAMGVYVTLNRTDPRVIARRENTAAPAGKNFPATSDTDILWRAWLLVDADPPRPSGISASESEHAAALTLSSTICDWLGAAGWPDPVRADSGNGGHLLYRIDLPAKDDELVKRVLKALAAKFDIEGVKVDTSVHNPSRVSKLYGTLAGKGDSTQDRPHRLARIIETPDPLEIVTREQLEAVAAWLPAATKPARSAPTHGVAFNLDSWIAQHLPGANGPDTCEGGRVWVLRVCPWDSSHTNGAAFVRQADSGAISAGCHHNGCQGRQWADLREMFEPGYMARKAEFAARHNGNGHPAQPPVPEAPPTTFDDLPPEAPAPRGDNEPEKPTDDELADEWHGQFLQTLHAGNSFRRYDTALGVWPELPIDTVRAEIMAVLVKAKAAKVKPSAHLLASVLELARIGIVMPADRLDGRLELIPCANGCYNRQTGQLEPHAPEHYATAALPFDYDPAALAQTWEYFLRSTIDDAYDFVQEFAGYCLTMETAYELALWLYGPPGSGKSTFLLGLQTMLGSRVGLLSLADVQRSRFALAQVPGKTLLYSTEQPADYIASTGILNALISGEPVTVEQKFVNAITVTSRAKVAWAMNSLPRVGEAASGLFRRVRVLKFPALAESKRDPALKAAIATEGAGILNWALRGLDRLTVNKGFTIPPSVVDATDQFRASNDIPAAFVAECCVLGDYKTKAGQLYQAYKTWCIETGHKPQSLTSLAADWDRLGFDKYIAAGITYRRGVGVKSL